MRWTPHRWGFGSGLHFHQIFGSGWPLVRWTPSYVRLWSGLHFHQIFGSCWPLVRWTPLPHRWDFGSGWHFWQIFGSGWLLVSWTPWQRNLLAKCVTTSVRLTSGQMYPQDEASCQVDIYSDYGSGWPLVRCTPRMRLWVRVTFSQTSGQADLWFFPIAFPICDYKSSSWKVVPWCSNTPNWWWKDMHKLVSTGNSLDSISLHLVQEYVIRWHRYKTANGPCK